MEIIYVPELPEGLIIITEQNLLVGTGAEQCERLCPKERE
jgi:hypothetical protein